MRARPKRAAQAPRANPGLTTTPPPPPPPEGANGWGANWDPLTQVGDETWADYAVTATVRFGAAAPPAGALAARGPEGPLGLAPCDAADAAQAFLAGPAAGFLQNVKTHGCIDINGCDTAVDLFECVTSGGSCGVPGVPLNLQWSYDAASGALASALPGKLLTAANGSLWALPPGAAGGAQAWDYNATSGALALRGGGGQCVSAPPTLTYARLCGRVASLSGFAGGLTATCLSVERSGAWALVAGNPGAPVLANGTLPGFDGTARHAFSLAFAGPLATAAVDGVALASDVDVGYAVGNIVFGCGWHACAWSNVTVAAA